jgi:alpha-L-fucosidase 2
MNHGVFSSRYDVSWNSPSGTHNGSMPLGNGDVALNAWVDEEGDLLFYISKSDCWDEYGRLLKIGRIRFRLDPRPVIQNFEQTLVLADGAIVFRYDRDDQDGPNTEIRLRVDANHPLISVTVTSSAPVEATASFEVWRSEHSEIAQAEASDVYCDDPEGRTMIVEPDIVYGKLDGRLAVCHHNATSIAFPLTSAGQGLDGLVREDPLLGRTFGAMITAEDAVRTGELGLTRSGTRDHLFSVYVHTDCPSTPDEWLDEISRIAGETKAISEESLLAAHHAWWRQFWNRSSVDVRSADAKDDDSSSDGFVVSRGYALQRFINACAGRGHYPIKFNGSLFTVPFEDAPGNADYRKWGPGYWWQNTRLPYVGMCASGDFDLMRPFFKMYANELMSLFRHRTSVYFGHSGAFIPECICFWGDVFPHTYGWTPFDEREDKLQEAGWHKWEWVAGPEFVFMLLDYYDYTLDEAFLAETVLPAADEIIRFFDEHYRTDEQGRLVMHPSQALETWWDCTNPAPEIAGLRAIIDRLLELPRPLVSSERRAYWEAFREKLPEIPTMEADGKTMLAPAGEFADKRNSENPELYAVFPFRLFALNRPNVDWALEALDRRADRGAAGWRQDDIFMAYLGRTDEAMEYLVSRARTSNAESRFPAFWGPNYDWLPDQDHGGVLIKALQSMLMQCDGMEIILLPAWPVEWEVDFELQAPYRTTVRGSVRGGEMVDLEVLPVERRGDIRIMSSR